MPSHTSGAAVERAISQLTTALAGEVIAAFLAAPLVDVAPLLDDLRRPAAPGTPGRVRTPRRAPEARSSRSADSQVRDRSAALDRIVAVLATSADGMRSEVIRRALSIDKALFLHAVADGIEVGRLRKTGRLRGTRYFAA